MLKKHILLCIMLILISFPTHAYAASEEDRETVFIQNIGGINDELIQKFNDSYMLIPENVREKFEEDGWKI